MQLVALYARPVPHSRVSIGTIGRLSTARTGYATAVRDIRGPYASAVRTIRYDHTSSQYGTDLIDA
eukprot:3940569-Rhodomonas_salina.3